MSKWKNISLFKFQQIETINASNEYDNLNKVLFSACVVFGMTEHQLDTAGIKRASKVIGKVNRIFSSEFQPITSDRIGKYILQYDVSALTFGQYIELSFFLQGGVGKAHYSLASISRTRLGKYKTAGHWKRAEYFLSRPAEITIGCLKTLMAGFEKFNKEYKGLFGLDAEAYETETQHDPFNKRYGWTYSASCVAEYERITLDDAFGLPVRQALNDLAYLKAKVIYEAKERKKMMREHNI